VLGGFEYLSDPLAVTFRVQGKLITVHGKKIAVNALQSGLNHNYRISVNSTKNGHDAFF